VVQIERVVQIEVVVQMKLSHEWSDMCVNYAQADHMYVPAYLVHAGSPHHDGIVPL